MIPTLFPVFFWLAVLARLSLAQDNSQIFSQYIGAPTASAAFNGPSASLSSAFFKGCTNYIHGLQGLSALPSSASVELNQVQVHGVCQLCTSVQQSRVDSCCAQPTSVDCFGKFANQQAPATAAATPTTNGALATSATAPSGTTAPSSTSASNGGMIDTVSSKRVRYS